MIDWLIDWLIDICPEEAFENVGMSMFGYMTDIATVDMTKQVEVEANGEC